MATFPFQYTTGIKAANEGQTSIAWEEIEQVYPDERIDLAGDKYELEETNQHTMRQFRRVKRWLQEEYSTLHHTYMPGC